MKLKINWRKLRILFISDVHLPYEHPDFMSFLRALKKKYNFDLVVSVGDLGDFHNVSFHDSDPDLYGAGHELEQLQIKSAELEKLFPKMIIIGSNHGDLPLRKILAGGLPRAFLRPYNDLYGVGKGWSFVDDLMLVGPKGEKIYVCHGICKNGITLVKQRGVSCIQGHFHTEFKIDYISNPDDLLWSMQVGCLINPKALAFAYDKLNLQRPIIGTGGIVNGAPKLFPMMLNEKGSWTGLVP